MGDISEHFSKRDFVCRCKQCNRELKISLTIVGILELIRSHFRKRVEIAVGHICEEESARLGENKKNYHVLGKAVKITVAQTPPEEVFKYVERIPQVKGVAIDPVKNFVYFDIRDRKEKKWVFEDKEEIELTPELRSKYNLGEPQPILFNA